MLNIKLPKTRYKLAAGVAPNYPLLEMRADGMPIPIAYGHLDGIIPVCINTDDKDYKIAGHAIQIIDVVRDEIRTLVLGSDYNAFPAVAELELISTPHLAANTTYYFVIEADYGVDIDNHVSFKRTKNIVGYADGQLFTIDNVGPGVWTLDSVANPDYPDLHFQIFGRTTLSSQDIVRINCVSYGWDGSIGLKDDAARTRLAQSFLTGAEPFYLTRIRIWAVQHGAPSGLMKLTILSEAGAPIGVGEVRVGSQSEEYPIDENIIWSCYDFYFPLQNEISNLTCDIHGATKGGALIDDGADMLEDLVVNRIGKPSSILEPTALLNFKNKRTQEIAAYIDRDMTFGEIVGKLESSLLFKFVPLHDGTYATTVYEADTVEVRPHFFDEHFLSFSMRCDFSSVKAIVKIKYDEDPGNNEFKVAEADSDIAKFVYGVEDTLEVETYLKQAGDAATLATDYLGMYEVPPLEITFEIRGYGLNLIPGRDKVKITCTRAAYAGGTINGVLFRIVKITKKPGTASTEIVAILDTQTY